MYGVGEHGRHRRHRRGIGGIGGVGIGIGIGGIGGSVASAASARHSRERLPHHAGAAGGSGRLYFEFYLNNLKGFTLHAIPDATAAQEVSLIATALSQTQGVRRCRKAPSARPRQMC